MSANQLLISPALLFHFRSTEPGSESIEWDLGVFEILDSVNILNI